MHKPGQEPGDQGHAEHNAAPANRVQRRCPTHRARTRSATASTAPAQVRARGRPDRGTPPPAEIPSRADQPVELDGQRAERREVDEPEAAQKERPR